MDDLFRTKGTLTVSIGEGYLSAFEVGALNPGDVVRTSRLAGAAHAVLYNGLPLARCEAVVLSGAAGELLLGARISDTDFPDPFGWGPVRKDEVGELLPFVVELGSIRISLRELEGVGVNSLIGLGAPWSDAEDAALVVAGMLVARGKVVVDGEEMGLRVTRVLASPAPAATLASSGFFLDRGTARHRMIKDYDFRRPDKFSKPQTLRLRDTHAMFLQNLRARFPSLGDSIQSEPYPLLVDQCTLGEAVAQLDTGGLRSRIVVENRPWRRVPRDDGELYPSRDRFRVLAEEEGSPHPVDPAVRTYVEAYLNAESLANRNVIFLYHGDEPEVRAAVGERPEALLACLRAAWRTIVELNPAVLPADEASRAGAISDNEMVIIVTFAAKQSGKPILALVYPYLTLEPFARLLGR